MAYDDEPLRRLGPVGDMGQLRAICALRDVELILPNWEMNMKLSNLLAVIPDDADAYAVVVFGSSIREPTQRRRITKFLWWERVVTEPQWARDIDVAVILNDDGCWTSGDDVPAHQERDDMYGDYFTAYGKLHVGAVGRKQFDSLIRDGDDTARNIKKHGVVLVGDPGEFSGRFFLIEDCKARIVDYV